MPRWVVRLGDGTEYSRERMAAGLANVAPLLPELFDLSGFGVRGV
jgi:ring-1,2-phenylacetyl-CoA epoxidase subunit PaaC